MSTLIPIPKLGQSEETVKIERWRVKEGDKIRKGDVLFEVETDKAVLEVESQFEGTVLKIVVPEGREVAVMSTAAVIGEPGEKIPELGAIVPPAKEEKSTLSATSPGGNGKTLQKKAGMKTVAETKAELASPVSASTPHRQMIQKKVNPSPRARKFAENYLISLDKVLGTGGESGRVTEADVRRYLDESGYRRKAITPSAFNLARKEKLELLSIEGSGEGARITLADVRAAVSEKPRDFSAMRRIIAKRLVESKQNIPHFYVTVSVDMTEVVRHRARLKEEGNILSVSDFIIKATALTLREFPMMNAETDGLSGRYKSKINIGVAVSLENGLVVPVIRNADRKDLDEIHALSSELAVKARNGKLLPDEMKGGTFTISNMGMLNVENFSAIINPGESAILAVSTALPTPVVRDSQIVIRDMMKMTVSADHRIVDGSDSAKFANALKRRLEMLEIS